MAMDAKVTIRRHADHFFDFASNDHVIDFVKSHPEFARVHTDDDNDPTFLFLSVGHYLFVSENVDEDIVKIAMDKLFPGEVTEMLQTILVFFPNEKVRRLFQQIHGSRIDVHHRRVYNFYPDMDVMPCDDETSVKKITREWMARDLNNIEMVRGEIMSTNSYVGMDDFYQRGIGYMTLDADDITGFCVSEYQSGQKLGVGIHVRKTHRERGLATAMTRAFLNEAKTKDFTVYWDCWAENEPSVKTASGNGFILENEYPVIVMRLVK
jgi:GNAT superfamily N-acetyltransferase